MADKLYFMIRDLYAIHTNVLRRQLEDKKTMKSSQAKQQQQQQQMQQHQQQLQFQHEQQMQQQMQQQQQHQQQLQQLQQFQIQQFSNLQTPLSITTNGLADWTLPYYNAAMSTGTPNLDSTASQLELEFATANNVFQIPEGYDQPLMFPSTGLTFNNSNRDVDNNNL